MRFDDLKQSVLDWFRDKRYAQGRAPLIVISIVMAACLIWIGSFFVGGESYEPREIELSPRHVEAARITQELKADERFRHVDASPSPDNENMLVINGEVYTKADRAALEVKVKSLTSTYTITIGEVLAMDSMQQGQ